MSGLPLSRIFWIGAAGILIFAAVVAIGSILGGSFSDTDWKILGTLFSLLLAGATAISGLALVERRMLIALGWSAAVASAFCFLFLAAAIWDEFADETLGNWAASAIPILVALLLVTTQRLLLRVPQLTLLFVGTGFFALMAALATAAAIWAEEAGGGDAAGSWETAAILWILAVLGYLLLPLLQRFMAAGPPAVDGRVLGALDNVELVATRSSDGLEVHLVPGERLLLRRRS